MELCSGWLFVHENSQWRTQRRHFAKCPKRSLVRHGTHERCARSEVGVAIARFHSASERRRLGLAELIKFRFGIAASEKGACDAEGFDGRGEDI